MSEPTPLNQKAGGRLGFAGQEASQVDDNQDYVCHEALRPLLSRADICVQPIPDGLLEPRVRRALQRIGISRLGQLADLRTAQFLRLGGVGLPTLGGLRNALAVWFPISEGGSCQVLMRGPARTDTADAYVCPPPLRGLLRESGFCDQQIPQGLFSPRIYRILQRNQVVCLGQLADLQVARFLAFEGGGAYALGQVRYVTAKWVPLPGGVIPLPRRNEANSREAGNQRATDPADLARRTHPQDPAARRDHSTRSIGRSQNPGVPASGQSRRNYSPDVRRALATWAPLLDSEGKARLADQSASESCDDGFMCPEALRHRLAADDLKHEPIPQDVIPVRAYNAFRRSKIVELGQLAELRVEQALRITFIGAGTLRQTRRALEGWTPPYSATGRSAPTVALPATATPYPFLDMTVEESLPDDLRDALELIRPVVDRVSARDQRFGSRTCPPVAMSELLRMRIGNDASLLMATRASELEAHLTLLVERTTRLIPLVDELEEILPGTSRSAQVFRSRWGWDGAGPKTLEETGQQFGVTRERIRQVEKKVQGHLRGRRAYLPSAEGCL